MVFKHKQLYLALATLIATQSLVAAPMSPADYAKAAKPFDYPKVLGWVVMPNRFNICDGFYRDFPIPYTPNPLVRSQAGNYDISADHSLYSFHGASKFSGHVQITQPTQQINAGHAYLYRDKKTGKIDNIKAYDHVRLYSPGTLVVAHSAKMNTEKHTITLYNAAYRMATSKGEKPVPVKNPKTGKVESYRRYQLNYWGHAKELKQISPKHYEMKHATYTTCPPVNDTWHLHASSVYIDKKTAIGSAWNTVLWVKGVPVFYFPYVNFPLNNKRKSGFLSPTYSTSTSSGATITAPFYWNIAPNYDAVITPAYLNKRGYQLSTEFRYLVHNGHGKLKASFLPNDKAFKQFKRRTLANPSYADQPQGLNHLRKDSDNRYAVSWMDQTQFTPHWSANVNYNRVSDDYYVLDLGKKIFNNSDNQALQQGQIQYQGEHWDFMGQLQHYQTLHPVTQLAVDNQYARLPELQLNGFYSNVDNSNFDLSLDTEGTRFFKVRAPDTSGPQPVIGNRFSVRPIVDYPIVESYGFLTPRIQLQLTQYQLQRQVSSLPDNPSEAIPIFDLKGGLYFDRSFNWFGTPFEQTLEPQFYYLYVPYQNQNKLPIFDTTTQSFDYNFMYLDNRFSGLDRIGDANRVTLGVTTSFVNENTGKQKGSASIGEIVYFKSRKVTLCSGNGCGKPNQLDRRVLSPIAGQATYDFTSAWSTTAGLTWDPYADEFSNQSLTASYQPKPRQVLNLTYNLAKSGGALAGEPKGVNETELKEVDLSGAWLFARHWDLLGRWDYSWAGNSTKNHANAYLAGLEYDSCCWAVRLVGARTFIGVSNTGRNEFDNAVYLQFDLKGLGSFGNNDASGILDRSISGYQNTFDQELI